MPIVTVFTANAMQRDRDKCLVAGMDGYISKPVTETALSKMLKKWLAEKVEIIDSDNENIDSPKEIKGLSETSNEALLLDYKVFNVLKDMFGDAFPSAVASSNSSAISNIKLIEEALENGDAANLEHAAHSLKGASAQFGAILLSDVAQQMETYGKAGEIEKAKEILSKLKKLREEVEKLMAKHLA